MQMADRHAPGSRFDNLRHRTETGTQAAVGTDFSSTAVPHMAIAVENNLLDEQNSRHTFARRHGHGRPVCAERAFQIINDLITTTERMAV